MLGRSLRALAVVLTLPALARAERVPSRIFTTADGLANNVVQRIVPDSRGFLWFCTREGLSRFDGYTFVTYGIDEGLPSANIKDFLETRDGSYRVATSRGLVRFDPARVPGPPYGDPEQPMFTVYPSDQGTAGHDVWSLLEDRQGIVWVGTESGLYRLRTGSDGRERLERVELGVSAAVLSLMEHPSSELWVGTDHGLVRLIDGVRVERYSTADGLPGNDVRALLTDSHGRVWLGTTDGGLALVARDPTTHRVALRSVFTSKDGLPSTWINHLYQTSDGRIGVATSNGFVLLRLSVSSGSRLRTYPTAPILPSGALAVAEDRNHQLWIGSFTGVVRLLTGGFTVFASEDGVPAASSLIETPRGELVAMTAGATAAGAVAFAGDRFTPVSLPIGRGVTSWGWNQMMLIDRDGDWWIGTRKGVVRIRGASDVARLRRPGRATTYSHRDGLAAGVVLRMFEDSRGDIWVASVEGAPNGLSRWERGTNTWRHYTQADGFPPLDRFFPTAFAEDGDGNVWVGFNDDGGLARYRDGRTRRFGAGDGVPAGTIRNLLVDRRGTLWVASYRSGLLRVDAPAGDRPAFSRYTTAEGLSSNVIGAVVEDLQGRIYAGTARGIDRLDPITSQVRTYRTGDGLPAGEIFSALRDRSGGLWFGCHGGMIRLAPGDDVAVAPPSVRIHTLSVNGQSRPVSAIGQTELDGFELPPGPNPLQVGFLAPGFGPADRLRYQIMLEGADRTWGAPSDQRTVSYANVGPGRYRFLVRAVTSDGVPSSNVAGFEFRVLAPLWQRWWFLSIAVGLAAAAAHGLHRHRLSRVLEMSAMRTRIATDLHDDIGANLTRIAVLSEVVRRHHRHDGGPADGRLAAIAAVARESVTSMSDIVWAISPERDRLNELTRRMREHAEEVFASGDVHVTLRVAEDSGDPHLGVDVRRDVYLIFKEATNNAACHSGCSRVDVELRSDGAHLLLTVIDDGAGFDVNGRPEGNGLVNMRRRAARLNGALTIVSQPGQGTTVGVQVPLNSRHTLPGQVGDIGGGAA